MAVIFFGDRAWRGDVFDFHPAAEAAESFTFNALTTYAPGTFDYFIYETNRSIDLQPLAVDHAWSVTGGGLVNAFIGNGLTVDADGDLTGGTVNVVSYFSQGGEFIAAMVGVQIDARRLIDAAATEDSADDNRLIQNALSGNDLAGLSGRNDRFNADAGFDLIFGNDGNDRLTLGDGGDAGVAGRGDDKVYGQAGDDALVGNQGDDTLTGSTGRDILDGGEGRDKLAGGDDSDTFVFRTGDGRAVITDFDATQDFINICSGAASFADVTLRQDGSATEISFGDVVISLRDTRVNELSAEDFRFNLTITETAIDRLADFFDTLS